MLHSIFKSTDLKLIDIANEFGFSSLSYLHRILRGQQYKEPEFYDKLYKLQFNLPGVDPGETVLILSYRDMENLVSELYNFLSQFAYLPDEKILKKLKDDEIPPKGSWIYKGDFKYGNTTEEYQIELPKIELA